MSPANRSSMVSHGALYLTLCGIVGVLMGLCFIASGAAAIWSGQWFSRTEGGLGSVVFGVTFLAIGVFLGKRGRDVQRLQQSGTIVSE